MTIPMMAPMGNFFLLFLDEEEVILVLRVSRIARASTGKRADKMEKSTNAKLVVLRSILPSILGKMGVSVFAGFVKSWWMKNQISTRCQGGSYNSRQTGPDQTTIMLLGLCDSLSARHFLDFTGSVVKASPLSAPKSAIVRHNQISLERITFLIQGGLGSMPAWGCKNQVIGQLSRA
jgi:hypothetical protein